MRRIHVDIIIKNIIHDMMLLPARRRKYRSWDSAKKAAASSYESADLTSFRVERSKGTIGNEEEFITASSELITILGGEPGIFVDLGGSAGEMCSVLQRRFPHWQFVVVETPAMVAAASALRPPLTFSETLPEGFTAFYSSGTLQYLDDPYGAWESALQRTSRYAFLARNAFSEKEVFKVQRSELFSNGAGPIPAGFENAVVKYPHRTISEQKLLKIANANGFKLVERIPDRNSGLIQGADDMYGADLLFRRI